MTITRPAGVDPVTAAVNEAIGWVRRVGVACSGGADSIALAHATMAALGAERVVVIHIDHQLSPGSSGVADGVASWARGQGATAVVRRVKVEARASIEAAARDARYAALTDLAGELALDTILVGHTARDQAETVLMRIVRGTGPAGLGGIPRARIARDPRCGPLRDDDRADHGHAAVDGHAADATDDGHAAVVGHAAVDGHAAVVADGGHAAVDGHAAGDAPRILRPLLDVTRDAIDAYVASHALPTWADPMNEDPAIFRVRVRHQLLPALRRENPQIDRALVRLAASASEWLDVIDGIAAPLARWPIACAVLATHAPAIRKRAVAIALERAGVGYDAVHLDALDELVMRASAGQVAIDLPDARVVRTYDRLDLAHRETAGATDRPTESDDAPPPQLVAPAGYLLRRWQPGDRMRPTRLSGRSRKLSDLFIDAKVPRDARAQARVVVRADGVIVWAEHLGLAFGEAENVVPRPSE